ncbi:MAG: L-histidine N(alpha)-methyltransferase [Candidatus Sericytochromatia bacterium]|nr:L-histidine N(alpha)-methyltransferase [Candidatus Sericytochromatia bacterium]
MTISTKKNVQKLNNLEFYDFKPKLVDFKEEVISGLSKKEKTLAPKLFYDKKGSELFEQIVELEEYYIPLIEKKLLMDNIISINEFMGENVSIIEPGSGSCEKVRRILSAHKSIKNYIPIEISGDFLFHAAEKVAKEFPNINIIPICADYLNNFSLPESLKKESKNKVIFFPGSSIGNYDSNDVIKVLKKFIELTDNQGGLLIGVDLKKDKDVLEKAYNDSKGITAQFNLNLLHRIKNELNVDLDVNNFEHQSIYNQEVGRIEMYIVSKKQQSFMIDNLKISFEKDEKIHTENSYKYTVNEFRDIALSLGYKKHFYWTDEKEYFSINYFQL